MVGTIIEAITRQRFDLYMQTAVLRSMGIAGGFTPETLSPSDIAHVAVLYRKGRNDVWDPSGPWAPQVDDYQGKMPAPRAGLDAYVPGTNATGFGPQGGLRTSVAGLGGCPFAVGATGNVATEDVAYLLRGMDIDTGVDFDALVDAGQFISEKLGRANGSRAARGWLAQRARRQAQA